MNVTIVGGSGGVGASVAFNLMLLGGHDVVLVDRDPSMVTSHVMDLEQAILQGGGESVRSGDAADIAAADVLVLTAAVPLTVNNSRLAYLNDNARIVRDVVDRLPAGWPGVLLMVTNPVDPLVAWAQRRTGLDRRQVVGYTINDSLRLRSGIAEATGRDARAVDAWVIGEHGDACVPLWDRVRAGGSALTLSGEQRAAAEEFLRSWYVRHVALDSGRSSTWTSGRGVARMAAALSGDEPELWPASIVLDGEYGMEDVALSVPVALGRGGVREIYEWPLTADERTALQRSAEAVTAATSAIGDLADEGARSQVGGR